MKPAPAASMVQRLQAARVVAIVRAQDADEALAVAEALATGGIGAIELTFTTPGVEPALAKARHLLGARVAIGAGTITTIGQLKAAIGAGAEFLVCPHLNLGLLEEMLATGVLSVPGVLTPSEVVSATELGANVLKLFPASALGTGYLKALKGPFPHLQMIPTGGISPGTAHEWLNAGALAVGLGSELVPSSLRQGRSWKEISSRAASLLAALSNQGPTGQGSG